MDQVSVIALSVGVGKQFNDSNNGCNSEEISEVDKPTTSPAVPDVCLVSPDKYASTLEVRIAINPMSKMLYIMISQHPPPARTTALAVVI